MQLLAVSPSPGINNEDTKARQTEIRNPKKAFFWSAVPKFFGVKIREGRIVFSAEYAEHAEGRQD
jgi:hypothetical protein